MPQQRPSASTATTGGARRVAAGARRSRATAAPSGREAMRDVLAYRVWFDQRRGWRYTNPNLEQLGLIRGRVPGPRRARRGRSRRSPMRPRCSRRRPPQSGQRSLRACSTHATGLVHRTSLLDRTELEQLRTQRYANLREPWGFDRRRATRAARAGSIASPTARGDRPPRRRRSRTSWSSAPAAQRLGTRLRTGSTWGGAQPVRKHINGPDLSDVIAALLKAAESYGLVIEETRPSVVHRLAAERRSALRVGGGHRQSERRPTRTPSSATSTEPRAGCSPAPGTRCSASRRASTPRRSSEKRACAREALPLRREGARRAGRRQKQLREIGEPTASCRCSSARRRWSSASTSPR